jgi:hypothetical protein
MEHLKYLIVIHNLPAGNYNNFYIKKLKTLLKSNWKIKIKKPLFSNRKTRISI